MDSHQPSDEKSNDPLPSDDQKIKTGAISAEELGKCLKERDEYLNSWKRAKADLINYQREETKRFMELAAFAEEGLVSDLMPVLESLDLGIAALKTKGVADKGIYLVRSQFEGALKKRGLETINAPPGGVFDPRLHESVGEIESEVPIGTIALEIAKGYMLNGKIIRAAKVKLSKGK